MRSLIGSLLNKNPIKFAIQGNGQVTGLQGSSGTQESMMRAYQSVSTLFAIIDRLATATAAPVWHLMKKGTEVEISSHPCIDLWNKPNGFYLQNDFIEATQQHMDLVGEMWWIVSRSTLGGGPPLELWPIRPDRMVPVPDPEKFISGFIYANGREKVPLELDDVIWTKKQNPLDPYRGIGPVGTLLADLDAEKYTASWNANFFRNSAMPGGIITVDRHLDDAQFEEMLLRWREQHQGVANAHRVGILEQAQFQEMRYTQRDMQFEQMRRLNQEIIAMAFGFPMHMLGVTKDINRANAETQEYMFQKELVVPRLERFKQMLNTRLLPMYGTSGAGLEWEYENPVPEDKKGDSEILVGAARAAAVLIDAGFDKQGVLDACHLPPIKVSEEADSSIPLSPGSQTPRAQARLREILDFTRGESRDDMAKDWTRRLDSQRSALERWLERRWSE